VTRRAVLVGEDAAGIQALRLLERRGWEVVAVVSSVQGRKTGATVANAARQSKLRVLPPREAAGAAFADFLRARRVDVLLNVHSLVVLDEEVVAAPAVGSFNLHPGPLPEYAGLNTPSWAIFNGERRYGVSLHWMEKGVDTGPVAWSRRFPILKSDTGVSLSLRCVRTGIPLIERLLERVDAGKAVPRHAQDLSRRVFFGARPPWEGRLLWSQPSRQIVDFVRASDYRPFPSPWGHPTTMLGDVAIGVAQASRSSGASRAQPGTVAAGQRGSVLVATGDMWVAVERVQVDGTYHTAAAILHPGEVLA
jgi:methionyl-tRNA formyltransferase